MSNRGRIFRANKLKAQPLPPHVKEILAPYFPNFDLDQIRLYEGIPWYVTMDADAYTDGNNIFFKLGKFDPKSPEGIALIGHEITHSVQFHTHGKWWFRARYLGNWGWKLKEHRSFTNAYFYNKFEIEARAMEQRIYDDLLYLTLHHHE